VKEKQTILSNFSPFFFPYNAPIGEEKQTILSDFSSFFFSYNTSTEGEEEKQTIVSDFSSLFFLLQCFHRGWGITATPCNGAIYVQFLYIMFTALDILLNDLDIKERVFFSQELTTQASD
jgi:hypothetical protein